MNNRHTWYDKKWSWIDVNHPGSELIVNTQYLNYIEKVAVLFQMAISVIGDACPPFLWAAHPPTLPVPVDARWVSQEPARGEWIESRVCRHLPGCVTTNLLFARLGKSQPPTTGWWSKDASPLNILWEIFMFWASFSICRYSLLWLRLWREWCH